MTCARSWRWMGATPWITAAVSLGAEQMPLAEGPEPGLIYLQDHGNPIRFRNLWFAEKK